MRFKVPTLSPGLTAGLAAGVTVLALSACSSGAAGGTTAAGTTAAGKTGPITIGFSPMNQSAPALIGLGKGLQGYAKSLGDKVVIADPNNDAATQVQQVTAWIQNKQVDAIWLLALNASSMQPVIKQAQANGIAVLGLGVPKDYGYNGPQKGVSFSTIDYDAYGKALGEDVAKCVTSRLAGKGQVVFLQDPAGAVGSDQAAKAFKAALASGAPDAKIVSTVDNKLDRLASQTATQSALQAHPDANVFVGQNDEAALGAVGAIKQAGKKPSQMCVGETGGNDEVLKAVTAGDIYVSVALQFDADLKQNVDKLAAMTKNPSATGEQLTVPQKVVTASQ